MIGVPGAVKSISNRLPSSYVVGCGRMASWPPRDGNAQPRPHPLFYQTSPKNFSQISHIFPKENLDGTEFRLYNGGVSEEEYHLNQTTDKGWPVSRASMTPFLRQPAPFSYIGVQDV